MHLHNILRNARHAKERIKNMPINAETCSLLVHVETIEHNVIELLQIREAQENALDAAKENRRASRATIEG
jgi:hypothetical protein